MLTGLSINLPEAFLSWRDNLEFLLRIVLSAIFGIMIGLERAKRQKEAGIRTHCIIAISSATFMILSKYAFLDMTAANGVSISDPARLAAQVVSGISFLGAGVIFRNRNQSIKGLTTAAGMWSTAAVGMAFGAGMYWLGIFATVTVVLVQTALYKIPISSDAAVEQELFIRFADTEEMQENIQQFINGHKATIERSKISRNDGDIEMKLTLLCRKPITDEEALNFLSHHSEIKQINI